MIRMTGALPKKEAFFEAPGRVWGPNIWAYEGTGG